MMAENQEIPRDQAGTLRELNTNTQYMETTEKKPTTRVFAVTSGKGGVGKTAIVANLSVHLAEMGKRVLILDADLGLANIDVVFGLAPKYNLNHFFSNEQELSSILVEGPKGIKILPAGSGVQRFTKLDSNEKMRLLDALDGMHNDFDYVIIDTEAGISENVTYFTTAAHEILVVTTPDPTAITDAYALMKLLSSQYHEKHFNLIVNFIKNEEEALEVYRKLTMVANRYLDISIDYIGSVPRDKMMVEAIRKQRVLVELYPETKTSAAFSALSHCILQEPGHIEPKGSIQFFWKRLLEFGNK